MTESKPFRAGVVGWSPQGRFLVERLKIQPDCELLVFSTDEIPDEPVRSLSLSHIPDWHRFLSASKLNAVLFLDARSSSLLQVQEALEAGLPVGVLPPLPWEPALCEELADRAAGRLFVLNPHNEEADFRAARQVIQSGELGLLSAIKRISWVADLVRSSMPVGQDTWFSQLLWEDVDQLLILAGELPQSVYAADYSEEAETYLLYFQFPSGLVGQVERRRGSIVPLDVGWTICGQTGGYANGHRFLRTAAGEIYDVSAEADPLPGDPLFDQLRRLGQFLAADSSWRHAVHVVKAQRAINQSAATGQSVALSFD